MRYQNEAVIDRPRVMGIKGHCQIAVGGGQLQRHRQMLVPKPPVVRANVANGRQVMSERKMN